LKRIFKVVSAEDLLKIKKEQAPYILSFKKKDELWINAEMPGARITYDSAKQEVSFTFKYYDSQYLIITEDKGMAEKILVKAD
jgi:hypothetical protein